MLARGQGVAVGLPSLAFGLLPLAALPCGHQEYHWDNPKHIKSDFRAMGTRVKVLKDPGCASSILPGRGKGWRRGLIQ